MLPQTTASGVEDVQSYGDARLFFELADEDSDGRLPWEAGDSVVMGRTPLHDAAWLSNGHY